MKYLLLVMIIVATFSLRILPASADCNITFTNCLSDGLMFCSYNSSSFWDTIYAYNSGTLSTGVTESFDGCEVDDCYYVLQEGDDFFLWLCVTIGASGNVSGCDNYACVDDSNGLTLHSGSSEYCCVSNTCSTDC